MTPSIKLDVAADITHNLDKIEAALGIIEPVFARHAALRDDVRVAIGDLDALIVNVERSGLEGSNAERCGLERSGA